MKKKLGVLGGMGPMATSVFFERVIKNTIATCDQEHIDMVILNHTELPDRTLCIQRGDVEPFLQKAKKAFEIFESLGISHIAIPCNTAYYFYEDFKKMTDIPIINMVDKTVETLNLKIPPRSRIGVLATNGTIDHQIYKESIEKRKHMYMVPEEDVQKKVMSTIYSIKASKVVDVQEIESVIEHMIEEKNCDKIILACTELSLLDLRKDLKAYCIDAMDVLVRESIRLSDKQWQETFLETYTLPN